MPLVRIITLVFIVLTVVLWFLALAAWFMTEPGYEPIHVFITAVISTLIAFYGWTRSQETERADDFQSPDSPSATHIDGNVEANIIVTGGKNVTVNQATANAASRLENNTRLPPNIVIEFWLAEDVAHFENKPGRYSNHLKFSVENKATSAIEHLKLEFLFPKLEQLINETEFHRFMVRVNRRNFTIREQKDHTYLVRFEPEAPILPGEKVESERASIIYSMELPDRERWLTLLTKSRKTLEWTLYASSLTEPETGSILIEELF